MVSKIRVQTVLQSHAIMAAMAGDSKEGVLTSCSTKATLDGVVFIMRSTGSSFMHMAADTAIRQGTTLKACVLMPGAVVLYLSSAPCRWHWHWFVLLRDSQAHTSGDRRIAALT